MKGQTLLGDLGAVDWTAIIEEGAAGMLGGAAFGGGSIAYRRIKHPAQAESEADQNAREESRQQGGDKP